MLNESDLSLIRTVEHRNQEVSDIKFSPGELFDGDSLWQLFSLLIQTIDTLPLERMTISWTSTVSKHSNVSLVS